MIRIAVAVFALLCLAGESQAQFLPNFQPFGGRFRCQPVPRCQPQYFYYTVPSCPQPYYVVPSQPYIVPSVPNGPTIVPAPRHEEIVPKSIPKAVVVPSEVVPATPPKVTVPAGPMILPAPKRN